MTEFDKKKSEYYQRISSYDIDSNINLNSFYKGEITNILLNPNSQQEISFGDAFFLLLQDISKIMREQYGYINYDNDNNKFMRYFSNYINNVLNDKSLKNELLLISFDEKNKNMNIEFNSSAIKNYHNKEYAAEYYAKILFDMISALCYNDILINVLSREGIKVKSSFELFEKLLIKSINDANEKAKKEITIDCDIKDAMLFYTDLFNNIHELMISDKGLSLKK